MIRINNRIAILCLMMVLVASFRATAPLSEEFKYFAGFTGIGAVALFGGAYFKNLGQGMLLPLIMLLLSDVLLMLTMGSAYAFNGLSPYVYGSFVLMTLVGKYLIPKVSFKNVLLASVVGVIIHWIVTDFGVWYGSPYYAQTFAGFWQVLVLAIPFEKMFLISTLVYSGIMFGSFEFLKVKYPTLAWNKAN